MSVNKNIINDPPCNSFCMMPFMHLYHHNDGYVYPCAMKQNYEHLRLGKTSEPISKLWNHNIMKKIRKDMLNGNPPIECKKECMCRITSNGRYANEIEPNNKKKELLKNVNEDGSMDNISFTFWIPNQSNLCNFRCVYCESNFSNRWYDYEEKYLNIKTNGLKYSFPSEEAMITEFSKYLDVVEEIHFAAGESSLQSTYYWMLTELIKRNRIKDVQINLITNLSNFFYKNHSILDLLNQFNDCSIFASLDVNGKYEEYIRNGTSWSVIEKNRYILKKHYPNIKFYIEPTITNLNILRFPNFHYEWVKKGFLNFDNVRYNVLEKPNWFKLNFLPDIAKEKAFNVWDEYENWLIKNLNKNLDIKPNKENPINTVNRIKNSIKTNPEIGLLNETFCKTELLNNFNTYISRFNELGYGNFYDIFPEFNEFKL